MPLFDFHCKSCGQRFEATIAFGSQEIVPCSSCHSSTTEKLLSVPGIVFRGSGFYKTDSRKTPSDAAPKASPETPAPTITAPTSPTKAP